MPRESFEARLERELAELKAGLEQLEASIDPRFRAPAEGAARPRARPVRRARSAAGRPEQTQPVESTTPPAETPSAPASAPEPAPPAAPPQVIGTDLADPKNFGLMPPIGDLERGEAPPEEYRHRLVNHIQFATRVLHTSGVPAAVWREWRAFEKTAQDRLRELNARSPLAA